MDDNRIDAWMDLPQSTQAETATRMLSTVENSAFKVAKTFNKPATFVNVTMNIGSIVISISFR